MKNFFTHEPYQNFTDMSVKNRPDFWQKITTGFSAKANLSHFITWGSKSGIFYHVINEWGQNHPKQKILKSSKNNPKPSQIVQKHVLTCFLNWCHFGAF